MSWRHSSSRGSDVSPAGNAASKPVSSASRSCPEAKAGPDKGKERDCSTACRWLPEDTLRISSAEFERTGFQGGLQWYRCRTEPRYNADLDLFAGRTIDVPAIFVAGKSDWGVRQIPGSVEGMQEKACTRMLGVHLIDDAGHWVQQEQPEQVSELLVQFLRHQDRPRPRDAAD